MLRSQALNAKKTTRDLCVVRVTSARNFSASARRSEQHLVILGSGWGGYELLRGIDKRRWNVTIVSPTNYFNFTPLLAGCAVGTLEFRSAVEPVRRYTPRVNAYQAWCDNIDFKQRTICCMPATPPLPSHYHQHVIGNGHEHAQAPTERKALTPVEQGVGTTSPPAVLQERFKLRYDKLIIAVGAYSRTFNIPGVKEHAYFLKDIKDARRIRSRILECFEQANQPTITDDDRRKLLHFCIVGGGPTGVEFAAELHDLLHAEIKQHFPQLARMAKISLYDVAPQILGSFDVGLQEWAARKFTRKGINILTQHHVERVEEGGMFVTEQGEVNFGMLVWSTGLAPNPLVSSINEIEKDTRTGSLLTDEHLNVLMKDSGKPDPDVWAIGDAAIIKGQPLPATAQVANQKAKYLFKKLNRIVKGKSHPTEFNFVNAGSLAYIGDWQAVYDRTSAAKGPKTKETGRLAWLLWRSAYFTMTLSLKNKILVPTYWFMNWIFGRDLSRF
ncbi:FAD/NAD(P)-binding domain-containing protein [Laetiporus sulphureus 93-53]|uniref:FAD/NAD(P)-binding domain-containing protein n=1 Tax=Laetiporus sulphureus 93-53 TaxID=1314785 RepID=A0A165DHN2_9APHY|nr:FAD/NAD(P)-binding domain-containing protein [Laetiporus sulphureus 93-53]KZT04901.1 FAD/NAD(P)-binding domain-containing protein [Laetiporus sulphureus 93-53]